MKTLLLVLALILTVGRPAIAEISAPPPLIARAAGAPVEADGKLDEAIWKAWTQDPSGAAASWRRIAKPSEPSSDQRTAYFAYDANFLYVALVVRYGDHVPADAETSGAPDSIRLDFDGFALGIHSDGTQISDIILPYVIPIQKGVTETDDGWSAEIAVQWSQLQMIPTAGMKIHFNIAGRDASGPISWAPVKDVRDVKNFGVLELR